MAQRREQGQRRTGKAGAGRALAGRRELWRERWRVGAGDERGCSGGDGGEENLGGDGEE